MNKEDINLLLKIVGNKLSNDPDKVKKEIEDLKAKIRLYDGLLVALTSYILYNLKLECKSTNPYGVSDYINKVLEANHLDKDQKTQKEAKELLEILTEGKYECNSNANWENGRGIKRS